MSNQQLIKEIHNLKQQKNAIILAHNYQSPEVQDIADFVGDSLELSKQAAETTAEIIVFCGVHFMAESAKMLSPDKKVLLPVMDAGCPMADMVDADGLRVFKEDYPDAQVVCYVNSSAEVKAESDICCTSSNAVKIVEGMDAKQIIMVPDRNLGSYVSGRIPDKEIICWNGFCITHQRVTTQELEAVKAAKKGIKILVHPECDPEVVRQADFVGSTSEILKFAKACQDEELIIGTEMGILHKLQKDNPDKRFYLLSPRLICQNMKKTKLNDVLRALQEERNEIKIDKAIRAKAKRALDRMMMA